MINAKNELRYLLVVRLLESAAQAGFLTEKQLATAKILAAKKYRPVAVQEHQFPRFRTP